MTVENVRMLPIIYALNYGQSLLLFIRVHHTVCARYVPISNNHVSSSGYGEKLAPAICISMWRPLFFVTNAIARTVYARTL